MTIAPIPINEYDRVSSLLDLNLDYGSLQEEFKNIVELVTEVTGMDVSVINLIDTFTQWSIAKHGITGDAIARDESVCQFTILEDNHYEVRDLTQDPIHKDRSYVASDPHLRYYFGVPLKTSHGVNIGSLCVLDTKLKQLKPDQIRFLKIVADEVVAKLKNHKMISGIQNDLNGIIDIQKKTALAIQDSLAGIIGISDVLIDKDIPHTQKDADRFIDLINERSKSILKLTRTLLPEKEDENDDTTINLKFLAERLNSLYQQLTYYKNQTLQLTFSEIKNHINFSRANVLAEFNNPISMALYLGDFGSQISINLDIEVMADSYFLIAIIESSSTLESISSQLEHPKFSHFDFKYDTNENSFQLNMRVPLQVFYG